MPFLSSDLDAVNIYALYREWYEKGYMTDWLPLVTESVNSTDYGQIYSVATGATPGLQPFTPGVPSDNTQVAAYKAVVLPENYLDSFFVPRDSLGGDVTGVFNARAAAMAKSVKTSMANLFVSYIQANPEDWTGNDFFGDHTYPNPAGGNFATQTNEATSSQVPSLAVDASGCVPTPLEAGNILFNTATYGQAFRTEANLVVSGDAINWVVLTSNPNTFASMKAAVNTQLLQTSTGASVTSIAYSLTHDAGNGPLWKFNIVYVPPLAGGAIGANDVVFLRGEDVNRPFILGEDPDQPEFLGLGSTFDLENFGVKFQVRKRMAFAPGHWHTAIKATISWNGG